MRRAFERVSVDKKAKLVLNEAQSERDDDVGLAVRSGLLRLVDELRDAGVPLHAVGLQGHLQPRYRHDPGRFADFLDALAERGVDIYVTEFDVRDDTFPDDVPTRDAMIADTAEKFLNNVLRVPAVKVVIAWELADNYSFYTDAARRKDPLAQRLHGRCRSIPRCKESRSGSPWRVPLRTPEGVNRLACTTRSRFRPPSAVGASGVS